MSVDRTSEFRQILADRRAEARCSATGPSPSPSQLPTRSQFASAASRIGAEIHATADKLGKLTRLAQSNSLFEDPTEEINALAFIIKQEITSLNGRLAQLQQLAAQMGAQRQAGSHSTTVVDSLKGALLGAAGDFQTVLHTRSENMRHMEERRRQFSAPAAAGCAGARACAAGPSAPPPVFACGGAGAGATCAGGCGGATGAPSAGVVPIFECAPGGGAPSGDGGVVIDIPLSQQQQLMPANQSYLTSRAQAVESIQSTIVELGAMFEQLAAMVAEQGAMVQRVDDGVDESLAHAHAGCVAAARAPSTHASLARRCARSCARPSTPAGPQARAAAPAMEVDIVESRAGDARLRGAPLLHRTIRHILRVTRAWWIGHTSLRRSVHEVPGWSVGAH